MPLEHARVALRDAADPKKAAVLRRFFKTGPGEYGEGDQFLGVHVPKVRAIAREYRALSLVDCGTLVKSPLHEERALGLFVVVDRAERSAKAKDAATARACFDFYVAHLDHINNWDLVDLSAAQVVGGYLFDKDRSILHELVKRPRLWDRRVAVIATFHFIRKGDFQDTLVLCEELLRDPEDLMHKATGWTLREVGKRGGRAALVAFLEAHGPRMPRTMLRYAIERFPEAERKRWLVTTRPG